MLDISSNPSQPQAGLPATDPVQLFGAYGVAVSGHYAFVAPQGCLSGQPCPNHAVGQPASTSSTSACPPIRWSSRCCTTRPTSIHATSVAIFGQYAYVTADYSNRLTVVDISNPLAPQIVASITDPTHRQPGRRRDLADGSYAYVANQINSPDEIAVVNISNPKSPQVVGALNSNRLNGAYRIRVRGSLAYVAASAADDVAVVDLSDPTTPRLAGYYLDTSRLWHTTGIDVDSTGRYAIATSPFLSVEKQASYPVYPLQPGGDHEHRHRHGDRPRSVADRRLDQLRAAEHDVADERGLRLRDDRPDRDRALPARRRATSCARRRRREQYTALATGSHTFTVQATDSAGNTAVATYTWTVTARRRARRRRS